VKALFEQAARMGHGVASLARAADRDPKALRDLAEKTAQPRATTLAHYVAALGFPSYVARALCDELTQNDRDDIRNAIRAKVAEDCEQPAKTKKALDDTLDALGFEVRQELLICYALAQSGFSKMPKSGWSWTSDELSMLPPGLLAIDLRLEALGAELRLRDRVDRTGQQLLDSPEARAAVTFLKRLHRLSDGERRQVYEQMYHIAMEDD
jgi:hypothetical protein